MREKKQHIFIVSQPKSWKVNLGKKSNLKNDWIENFLSFFEKQQLKLNWSTCNQPAAPNKNKKQNLNKFQRNQLVSFYLIVTIVFFLDWIWWTRSKKKVCISDLWSDDDDDGKNEFHLLASFISRKQQWWWTNPTK